jgi:hypothetical protein
VLANSAWADYELTGSQNAEMLALVTNINHGGLAFRAVLVTRMLEEANWAADRLKHPTKRPIQALDIQDDYISPPGFSVLHGTNRFPDTVYGNKIFNSDIPREARLRALKVGLSGRIDTANFEFGFGEGRLLHVLRLGAPNEERYANHLDDLVGKPSLINDAQAHELATQWLAAVEVDMTALGKLKWTVNQLHYLPNGATNAETLPLYYVDFGNKHYPANGNLKAFDKPLVSVEILGTTKELQEYTIAYDPDISRRPLLLVTNVADLARLPHPQLKNFNRFLFVQTNSIGGTNAPGK